MTRDTYNPFTVTASGDRGSRTAAETLLPQLMAEIPSAFSSSYKPEAPWELLGDALDALLAELPSEAIEIRPSPDIRLLGDRIAIGRGSRISPGVVIEGPVYLGREVEIRPGAYIRGGVWIGDGCIVGANTEVKRSILLEGARAPHLSYVGDSLLGQRVNLGAGTILSNFRHDGREVLIPHGGEKLATGRRKLGAVLGDDVHTGCNCVLHPGVVVGRDTHIYPGVQLRAGVYPAASIIKLRQEVEIVQRV